MRYFKIKAESCSIVCCRPNLYYSQFRPRLNEIDGRKIRIVFVILQVHKAWPTHLRLVLHEIENDDKLQRERFFSVSMCKM